MDIHLIFQIIVFLVWLALLPFLFLNKKITPKNVFYGMLFSVLMILNSLIRETLKHDFDMSWNEWQWYPANLLTAFVYYSVIKSYSTRENRVKCWIPKRLNVKK